MSILKKVIIFCFGCMILTDFGYCAMDEQEFKEMEVKEIEEPETLFGKPFKRLPVKKQLPQDPYFLAKTFLPNLVTPDLKGLKAVCKFSMLNKAHQKAVQLYFEENALKFQIKPSDFSLKKPSLGIMEKFMSSLRHSRSKDQRSPFVKFLDDLERGLKILKRAGASVKVDLLNPWIVCNYLSFLSSFYLIDQPNENIFDLRHEWIIVGDGFAPHVDQVGNVGRENFTSRCRKGFSLRHLMLLYEREVLRESIVGLSGILFQNETHEKAFDLLCSFKKLKRLDLAGLELVSGGIKRPQKQMLLEKIKENIPNLEGLNLSYSYMYPENATIIAGMKNLKELNLRGTFVYDSERDVPNGATIEIGGIDIARQLEWGKLRIEKKKVVERTGIYKMFDNLENLEVLDVSYSVFTEFTPNYVYDVGASLFVCFGGLKKIKVLKVEGMSIFAVTNINLFRDFDFFVPAENLKKLQELYFLKRSLFLTDEQQDKKGQKHIKKKMKEAFPETKIIYKNSRTFM